MKKEQISKMLLEGKDIQEISNSLNISQENILHNMTLGDWAVFNSKFRLSDEQKKLLDKKHNEYKCNKKEGKLGPGMKHMGYVCDRKISTIQHSKPLKTKEEIKGLFKKVKTYRNENKT
jgi:hypothetical protein